MKNKKTFLVLIVLFALLVGGAYALYSSLSQDVAPQQMIVHDTPQPAGEAETPDAAQEEAHAAHAPDFTVYDRNGNEVRFSQFAGKPTVLNFWASWCSSCVHEMPAFQEKYAELGDSVNFVMINDSANTVSADQASRFEAEAKKGLPIILCMHCPFPTREIVLAASRFWRSKGNLKAIRDMSGYVEKYKDGTTQDFVAYLRAQPLLKGILCGHGHIGVVSPFSPTAKQ